MRIQQRHIWIGATLFVGTVGVPIAQRSSPAVTQVQQSEQPPVFELDKSWPKPLPNNWALGVVWGVAVDSHDHVFALSAPARYLDDIRKAGKVAAPPVVEFDAEGNVVRAWGGIGQGTPWFHPVQGPFPSGSPGEHGIAVDHHDNVWISGGGDVVLKFSHEGKFLLRLGEFDKRNGSNDRRLLGLPANATIDPETNEIYVADGYVNQRIIVFDADTGAYKRHWGAYGKRPDDGPIERYVGSNEPGTLGSVAPTTLAGVREIPLNGPPPQRFFPSHDVRVSKDRLVYVADRGHNRLQVFHTDGTFVKEVFIEKDAKGLGSVSAVELSPSATDPNQYYLYIGKSASEWIPVHQNKVFVLRRSDLRVLGSFESIGNHYIAVDHKGNVITCGTSEMGRTRLPQRFLLKHMPKH